MQRIDRRAALRCALGLLLVVLSQARGATDPGEVIPNVTGFWSGEFESASGEAGAASLDVSDQDHRRFAGAFTFFPPTPIAPPNPCAVLGTASASGEVSLVGLNEEFFLLAHGRVGGGVMDLDFLLLFADGSTSTGTISVSLESGNGT